MFGVAALVGVVNIVLFIALATIGAVVYNLCADLVGGIEVTLVRTRVTWSAAAPVWALEPAVAPAVVSWLVAQLTGL